MKIVCFGDSNTWGYDPRGYFGGQYDAPWPELLAERLGCAVVNQGENGREIPSGAVTLSADTDLLIVMLGTNDLLQGAAPEAVCARMERFLRSQQTADVLLIAPPPMSRGTWVPHQKRIDDSKALAALYRTLSETLGIRFADAGQWDIPLAFDGVHFTEAGHRRFAEGVYRMLRGE